VIPYFRKGDKVNDVLNLTPSALLKIRKAVDSGGELEVEGGDGLVIRKGTPHKLMLQRKNIGFIAFLEVLLH